MFTAGVMAGSDRDAGFCSGGDEDDMSGLHSPSASEDSVEVQISRISLRNKRKLAEPRKIQEQSSTPLKKRRFNCLTIEETTENLEFEETKGTRVPSPSPFRPWTKIESSPKKLSDISADYRHEEERWRLEKEARRCQEAEKRQQEEVLSRLHEFEMRRPESPVFSQTSRSSDQSSQRRTRSYTLSVQATLAPPPPPPPPPLQLINQDEPLALVLRGETPRVPSESCNYNNEENQSEFNNEENQLITDNQRHQQQNGQRNYKNMTRERRIEANARERTRVHTISAAFDTLRRAIPAYSHNQKLSKLSVLRIACSYIMTLSKIATTPEGEETNSDALGACVDLVSRTIQTEGKLRKKKDE